ncbi:retrovirus-related pol polyprotein from transposon TNT 1-94 [Tanacetum coccineum]|uniref:Retrovirus-related pol polyprotein from transposon TNT 1-94 n=1 Tax=Tanacetum coccineum TaxID=301880 RepID=A0ABQ5CAH4_9ASTR
MKAEDWTLLDRQALGMVRLSLAKNVAYNVVNEKTTYGLFKALSNMYEKHSASNKVFLIRQLVNMKMKEGASVADHVNEFNSILSSAEDKGRGRKQDRGQKQNRCRSKSKKRGQSKNRQDITCWNCNKKGHFQNQCLKPVASKDKKVHMAVRDYYDALVCCVKNTIEDRIMDYGASFHATFCKEELEKFRLHSSKVCLADDKTLAIAGVGDVVLKTSFGISWTLKDVRYIPGLKRRLISVRQLDEEGGLPGGGLAEGGLPGGGLPEGGFPEGGLPGGGLLGGGLHGGGLPGGGFPGGRSKLEYKFQDQENSEDIFSFGSALEDFICVVFVPDRNIVKKEWKGKEVSLAHLRVFGCNSYVKVKDIARDKLDAKSVKCTFIGYGLDEMGYRFGDSKGQKDQVVLEDSHKEHRLSSEITQSLGRISDTSEGSENSGSFKDSGISDEEDWVDYNEIFSLVVKMTTIKLVMSIVASEDLHLEQLDVKTAFLHGDLDEDIYMTQPEGFNLVGKEENLMCKLNKSLYRLKQAPRQWYLKFESFMQRSGYKRCAMDHCCYLKKVGSSSIILLLYVDDMLVAGSDMAEIKKLKRQLSQEYEMKDLGSANQILSMSIMRDKANVPQEIYKRKVLEKFNMKDAKARCERLGGHFKLIGSVMYAMEAVKWLLRYLKCTSKATLCFSRKKVVLEGFSDSDYGGCLDSGKSTTGYFFTVGGTIVSWMSRIQKCVAMSTTEAEYMAIAETGKELVWLKNFLEELDRAQTEREVILIFMMLVKIPPYVRRYRKVREIALLKGRWIEVYKDYLRRRAVKFFKEAISYAFYTPSVKLSAWFGDSCSLEWYFPIGVLGNPFTKKRRLVNYYRCDRYRRPSLVGSGDISCNKPDSTFNENLKSILYEKVIENLRYVVLSCDYTLLWTMTLPVQNINHSAFSLYPLPPEPVAEPNVVDQWTALDDAHTEIACLMLGSMTPELHRQFELHYPYDMIQELRSMFEKQAGVESLIKSNLSMLANKKRVWGCEALVKRDTPDKLEQRSVKCIFIGYPKETMGYYFYFPPKNKIVVARYAEFFEKRLISQKINQWLRAAGRFEEIQEEEDTTPSESLANILKRDLELVCSNPGLDQKCSDMGHGSADRQPNNWWAERHQFEGAQLNVVMTSLVTHCATLRHCLTHYRSKQIVVLESNQYTPASGRFPEKKSPLDISTSRQKLVICVARIQSWDGELVEHREIQGLGMQPQTGGKDLCWKFTKNATGCNLHLMGPVLSSKVPKDVLKNSHWEKALLELGSGHFKDKCPKAGNQQNDGARGRAYVVVENPQQNPNVVTGGDDEGDVVTGNDGVDGGMQLGWLWSEVLVTWCCWVCGDAGAWR